MNLSYLLLDWNTPAFPVTVTAAAAAIPPTTLRQWITRYADDLDLWAPGSGAGAKAEGEGLPHQFSLRGVLHIAAAARLVEAGFTLKQAYLAAAKWVHLGSAERLPAALYGDGKWTLLIAYPGADARVIGVTPKGGKLPLAIGDLFGSGHPVKRAPTIVHLDAVDSHARGVCEGYLRQ